MQEEDSSRRDFIGSIDRSVNAFGLAVIAFLPTLFFAIFRPDKLYALIGSDLPKGRQDYLLGSGIFFLLSTAIFFLMLSILSGQDATGTGVVIGDSVNQAVLKGNIGGILASLAPTFLVVLLLAVLSWVCSRFTMKTWTILLAMKTSLYLGGVLVWLLLCVEGVTSGVGDFGTPLRTGAISFLTGLYILYFYIMVFRRHDHENVKGAIVSAALIASIFGVLGFIAF